MQLSVGQSQRFSFGDAAVTQQVPYQMVDTQQKLPYNPFIFDLKLIIFKSKVGYEEIGTQISLQKHKTTVFGRKKRNNIPWEDSSSVPYYLNAQITSQKHFSIDQKYTLKDLASKHGTYYWIHRNRPKKLIVNDTYLIAKQQLLIRRVAQLPKPYIQIDFQGEVIKILPEKKLFLIGSHPKCDLIIGTLMQFEVCINAARSTIFTHLDQEDATPEHGLWYCLKNERDEIQLQNGDLFMVDPYIFKVAS